MLHGRVAIAINGDYVCPGPAVHEIASRELFIDRARGRAAMRRDDLARRDAPRRFVYEHKQMLAEINFAAALHSRSIER